MIDTIKNKFLNIFNKDDKKVDKKRFKMSTDFLAITIGVIFASSVSLNIINAKEKVRYTITTNKAEEYFYNADYKNALKEYQKIADKDKLSPIWDLKISEIYSIQGDIDNSRKYIGRAKTMKSKDEEVLNYIVFTESMNKDYFDSMKDGEAALKILPKSKILIQTMFTVYMENNKLDQAKQLIKNYPINMKSAYELAEYARMQMIVGNTSAGFVLLKDAWNLDKDEYRIYDVLSQIAVYDRDNLLESISKLSDEAPNDVAYKMWLAKVYSEDADTANIAEKILNDVKNKNVGKVEYNLIYASVLQNTNQSQKADELIDQVIRENSTDYRALHTAGWYYLNKKDYSKAEKYCKESIVKNKDYPDNYGFLMPEILKAEGNSYQGEPYFRTALRLEPYNYNIMLTIANYYWYTTKNTNKAMEYFKFAEIVKPLDPEIKYNMAEIYLTNKDDKNAMKIIQECIKLDPSIPKYHRTLGTIYMFQGNTSEAIKEIRSAYNDDQEDIMTLNNAGAYYIMVEGNLDRGLYNFTKAKEGINAKTDKYTKDMINDNYTKAKKLSDDFQKSTGNETLKIPEFTLFY